MRGRQWKVAICVLVAVTAAVGWVYLPLLPLAVIVPVLWARADTKWAAIGCMGAYFAVATATIVPGLVRFFDTNLLAAVGLWALIVGVQLLPWGLVWPEDRRWRQAAMVGALVVSSVPPLAAVAVANPLLVSGLYLPGAGLIGVFAVLAAIVAMAQSPKLVVIPIMVSLYLVVTGMPVMAKDKHIRSVDTTVAHTVSKTGVLEHLAGQFALVARAGSAITLYPESALGNVNQETVTLWQEQLPPGARALVGGSVSRPRGGKSNVLLEISGSGAREVYVQRFPPPLAMWRPWDREGYAAPWGSPATVDIDGRKYAVLICYEQLLTWPMMEAGIEEIDGIIAIGNLAYARGTFVPVIQKNAVYLWSRLYGVPVAMAFNE